VKAKLLWRQYRYLPYERAFALAEVRSLFGLDDVDEVQDGLIVPTEAVSPEAASRLTYFDKVILADGTVIVPQQVNLELSSFATQQKRQATRYSAHGLHEYKGKFNPQVVRAIGNRLCLARGAHVLDPFSGSGTTLLEAAHAGWNATGIDRNPLAVMISNAKVRALTLANGQLAVLARAVSGRLREWTSVLEVRNPSVVAIDGLLGSRWRSELPADDYLQAWFPAPVLAQVVLIRRALEDCIPDADDRRVFEVLVSDQLRECSFQEPADLRIRRRKEPNQNYPLLSKTLAAISEHTDRVSRARRVLGRLDGEQRALLGDVREPITNIDGIRPDSFDAIICSPPYATALPYIDTQRLSLVMFGLLEPSAIRTTEAELVGGRDISLTQRECLEDELSALPVAGMPASVVSLCRSMLDAAKKPGNGFRRRNTPALVYRYFRDMVFFFRSIQPALRPGAPVALVVGANRTTLAGTAFSIDTPRLLASVAHECGFDGISCEVMDTYQRYDLHQKNSINDEMLVLARCPGRERQRKRFYGSETSARVAKSSLETNP
jgi:SAM-dependent methyltransferase